MECGSLRPALMEGLDFWRAQTGSTGYSCQEKKRIASGISWHFGNGQWHAAGTRSICKRTESGDWVRWFRLASAQFIGLEYGGGYFVAPGQARMIVWPQMSDVWSSVNLACLGANSSGTEVAVAHWNGRWVAGTQLAYNAGNPTVLDDWKCMTQTQFPAFFDFRQLGARH